MGQQEQGVNSKAPRYQLIPRTLSFVTCGAQILLLKGSPNKRLWAGKYNALGGHVERGEDVRAAAEREIREESGVEVSELRLRGIVTIDAGDPATGVLLFVFHGITASSVIRDSTEGTLEWRAVGDLPIDQCVEDLPALLPRVLAADAAPFFASYHYDEQDALVIRFHD